MREAVLEDFAVPSLTLLYESALMPAIKRGDARRGPACFAFIFTAAPVSTEVAFFVCGRVAGLGVRFQSRWWGEWGREGLVFETGRTDLFVSSSFGFVPFGKISGLRAYARGPVNIEVEPQREEKS